MSIPGSLVRIGVFYDGSFFTHVSDYFLFTHGRHSRLSIGGLHDFVRENIAELEQTPVERCRVVEAHYVRGRMSTRDAEQRERLRAERQWDETLLRLGVTPHYLPLATYGGTFEEKGVDVWFALEAYERARDGHFDVAVLFCCDGDFAPLARKLQRCGVRVFVIGCDIANGNTTRTSRRLMAEATYAVLLNEIVDDPERVADPRVLQLFLNKRDTRVDGGAETATDDDADGADNSDEITEAATVASATSMNGSRARPPESLLASELDDPQDATAGGDRTFPAYVEDGGELDDEDEMPYADAEPEPEPAMSTQRMYGTIGKLKEGFGFVRVVNLPRDIFFHSSAVNDRHFNDLREGEEVQVLVTENSKGFIATRLTPNSPPPLHSRGAKPMTPRAAPMVTYAAAAVPPTSNDEGYPL